MQAPETIHLKLCLNNGANLLEPIDEATAHDIKRLEKRRRKKKGTSTVEGLVLPGRIAMATRGASVDEQTKEHARLVRQANLQGEAEPMELTRVASSASDGTPAIELITKDIGKGIGHSSKAIATLPLQMWLAVALGFHNAPRLYGDKTVRPSPQGIDGFRTGVKVAGKEFWHGMYDGVIGVVRIPYLEFHDTGMSAVPKGVAQGLGGLVLKPVAGTVGLGAYTAKGVQRSFRRLVRDTEKTTRWIRQARIAQGQRDVQLLEDGKGTAPECQRDCPMPRLAEVRNHAIRQWTTVEKDKVAKESKKQKRLIPLNKSLAHT